MAHGAAVQIREELVRSALALLWLLASALTGAEAKLFLVADPVQAAVEAAADGRHEEALRGLEKAVEDAPADSDAWAALSVVSQDAGAKARAREAERRCLDADPEQGRKVLASRRASYKALKAEILAAKEKRGEIPLPVVRRKQALDPQIWARLEAERRPSPTPLPNISVAQPHVKIKHSKK